MAAVEGFINFPDFVFSEAGPKQKDQKMHKHEQEWPVLFHVFLPLLPLVRYRHEYAKLHTAPKDYLPKV